MKLVVFFEKHKIDEIKKPDEQYINFIKAIYSGSIRENNGELLLNLYPSTVNSYFINKGNFLLKHYSNK